MKSRLAKAGVALVGIAAFLVIGFFLENDLGVPFYTTYRIGCAAVCLFLIFQFGADYPGERWPRVALVIALLVNVGIFFTPLVEGHASRGEIMLFLAPDAVVVLAARTVSYPVVDDHQRAVRGQLIVGSILAAALCAILFSLVLLSPHTDPGSQPVKVLKAANS